jgi:hypothetical protein
VKVRLPNGELNSKCPFISSTGARTANSLAAITAMEFANVDEACREASRALAEIARDELLTGNHRELAIHIHEAGGLCMLRASLALQMQHPLPGAELPPERLSRRAG